MPRKFRLPLRPLTGAASRAEASRELAKAIESLDRFALAQSEVSAALNKLRSLPKPSAEDDGPDEDRARAHVALAEVLYEAGWITYSEYAFYSCFPVVSFVYQDRWLGGEYDHELGDLQARRDAIAREAGLRDDQDWQLDDRPPVVRELDEAYDSKLKLKEAGTLREFGLHEFAELLEHSPIKYKRIVERGRRAIHHPKARKAALADMVVLLAEEGAAAAAAGAYLASCVSYCSAMEGLLVLRCLRQPERARDVARSVLQPRPANNIWRWDLHTLIEVCHHAGWLPTPPVGEFSHTPAGWLGYMRSRRNLTHPARAARERPWGVLGPREANRAAAVYRLLQRSLREQAHN